MKIMIIFIGFIFTFVTCQQNEKKVEKTDYKVDNSVNKDSVMKEDEYTKSFNGRIFVYALGCDWDSQSLTRGKLYLDNNKNFRFELFKALDKKLVDQGAHAYLEYKYKEEILQGTYEINSSNQIYLKVLQYQYRNREDHNPSYQTTTPPIREIRGRLDSCEDRKRLVFELTNNIIPSEKYFEWVEENYDGHYISYNEGVREELEIKNSQDNIQVYYHSLRYEKPIELIVKSYDRDRSTLKIFFPNTKEDIYELYLKKDELDSRLYSKYSEEKKIPQYVVSSQVFKKIKNQYTDNPKDLSLKTLKNTSFIAQSDYNLNIDTVIDFQENQKVKFSPSTFLEFQKYFRNIDFEQLREKYCNESGNTYSNNFSCLQKIEKDLIFNNLLVKREDEILVFQLANNNKRFLKNNLTFGESTQVFWYQKMVNSIHGQISISLGKFWEWSNYYVLHHKSGEEVEISGTPYFSPNGKHFINYQNLHLYASGGISIQIWEIKDYGFDLIWQFQPKCIVRKFAWQDDNTILFESVKFDQTEILGYGKIEIKDN